MQAMRKQDKTLHVDMPSVLKKVSLDSLLDCSLPKGAQVDCLATEIDRLKQKGIASPYIFVDLKKYLPTWCDELNQAGESSDEEETSKAVQELARAMGAKPKEKRSLNLLQWGLAFDKYAIAATATNQMTFAATVAHKDICLQVAARAHLKQGRRHFLGVLYDQVCRKEWSEIAYASSSFNVSDAATKSSDSLLQRAENLYDQQFAKGKSKGNGKGNDKRPWNQSQGGWSASSWQSSQPAWKRGRH